MPDIGQPKIPGEPDGNGEDERAFTRQARMLRAALRQSAEPAVRLGMRNPGRRSW